MPPGRNDACEKEATPQALRAEWRGHPNRPERIRGQGQEDTKANSQEGGKSKKWARGRMTSVTGTKGCEETGLALGVAGDRQADPTGS